MFKILISSDVYLPVDMSMDTIKCTIGSLFWQDRVFLHVFPRKIICQRINGLIQECPSSPAITTVSIGDTLFVYQKEHNELTPSSCSWANFQSALYPEIELFTSSFLVIHASIDSIYADESDEVLMQRIFEKWIRLHILPITTVGIESDTNKPLSLYPNPASSIINVGPCDYSIFSLDGRIVDSGNTLGSIDISKLEPGIYFFKSEKETIRFIKN